MSSRLFCTLLLSLLALARSGAAQGKSGGGPPPGGPGVGGHGPGGSMGPGGPGGPSAPGSSPTSTSGMGGPGSSAAVPHFGPVGRWWDDKSVVRAVGLSKEQQRSMDSVFDANKQAILSTYKTFLAEQTKLSALSKQTNANQAQVFAAIDAVNEARAALQKANTQMLLQIRKQMDAEQIARLQKMQ